MKKKDLNPEVRFVHNLCKDINLKGRYHPFGLPRSLAKEGLELLTAMSDGRVVTSSTDGTSVFDPETKLLTPVCTDESRCACEVTDRRVVACVGNGTLMMEREDSGRLSVIADSHADWHGVSITAEEMTPLNMSVEGMTLNASYNPGDTVSGADRAKLSAMVKAAYEDLYARASATGYFFEPVLARAVIYDKDGNRLWRGPEVLVSAPVKTLSDGRVMLPMESASQTQGCHIEIPMYRLRVRTSAMVERLCVERATSLCVEIAPCFHSWTSDVNSATSEVTVMRTGTSDRVCSVAFPGADRGLSVFEPGRNSRLIGAALRCFDDLSVSIKAADNPYEHGVDIEIGAYGMPALKDTYAAMSRALNDCNWNPDRNDMRRHRLNVPHRFTSAHAVSTPAGVAYGAPGAILYEGYSPTDYASAINENSGAWKSLTTVTYSDGSVSRRVSRGETNRPTALNPLITYPDSSAVSIKVEIADEEGKELPQLWLVTLTPDETGCRAIGLLQNLAERTPSGRGNAWADTVCSQSRPVITLGNVVAIASPENPFNICSCVDISAEVTTVSAGMSNGGAWDFGRTRFYVFSPDRVTLVNVSSELSAIATTTLASVGIRTKSSVVATDIGETFFLGNTGTLYRIKGSTVMAMAKLPDWVDCLGFDVADNRLQAAATTGMGIVYHVRPADGTVDMTSTSPGPMDTMLRTGGCLLAATQNCGLVDMSLRNRQTPEDGTEVKLILDCDSNGYAVQCRMSGVIWPIASSQFEGRITIARKYITCRHAETTDIRVSGRLASPIAIPMMARPFNGVHLEISGKASADTVILTPTVIVRN